MRNVHYVFLSVLLTNLSCSLTSREICEKESNLLTKIASEYDVRDLTKYDAVILTYADGCDACIKKTRDFIVTNIKDDKLLFVACARSQKELNIDFPFSVRRQQNFIHDKELLALQHITTYPMIFYLNAGTVVGYDEITFSTADEILGRLTTTKSY